LIHVKQKAELRLPVGGVSYPSVILALVARIQNLDVCLGSVER